MKIDLHKLKLDWFPSKIQIKWLRNAINSCDALSLSTPYPLPHILPVFPSILYTSFCYTLYSHSAADCTLF